MHTSVIPADCRVSCHAATRWFGKRATADWRCSREADRVTPGERRVGGWIQGKQMGTQVNERRWCIYWHLRCHSVWHSTAAHVECQRWSYFPAHFIWVQTNTLITGRMSHTLKYWNMDPNCKHKERYFIIFREIIFIVLFIALKDSCVFLFLYFTEMHALHSSTEQISRSI